MRTILALLLSLSAGSAFALEIDTSPVTTGAIMPCAKAMALVPQAEEASFEGAVILTDAQISGIAMPSRGQMPAPASPFLMTVAKSALN